MNKANTSDTKAAFLDLHLSISNDIVSTKIYDKRDDFDCYDIMPVRKEEGKSYWKIPFCDDDATREK